MIKNNLILVKISSIIAPIVLQLATLTANSTCFFYSYQPKVPDLIKKND